jgi:hypothetical protein
MVRHFYTGFSALEADARLRQRGEFIGQEQECRKYRSRALENPSRWQVAVHEAAHAVAFLAAGGKVPRVYLTSDSGGLCEARGITNRFHEAVAIMAGEAMDTYTSAPRQHAPDTVDMKNAETLAREVDSTNWQAVKDAAWFAAGAFVAVYQVRIERLAIELYDRGELASDEVEELVGPMPRMRYRPKPKPEPVRSASVPDGIYFRYGDIITGRQASQTADGDDEFFNSEHNDRLVKRAMEFHATLAARGQSF